MPSRVYTYDREGRRNPPPRKGPSNHTRRILTVVIAILVLVLIIILIAHGCSKHNEKKQQEEWINHTSTTQRAEPSSPSTKQISQNMFPNLRTDYDLPYCITVNTAQEVVTVYERSTPGGPYNKAVKAFVCSTGLNGATSPGAHYTVGPINEKWHSLVGGVYGQYCTRIYDGILFHSVPYTAQDKGSLQPGEYNKLGQPASHGCIRLKVSDVKWIFENCPAGTYVVISNNASDPEPLGKPKAQKVPGSTTDSRYGWDPSDPDPSNPWRR